MSAAPSNASQANLSDLSKMSEEDSADDELIWLTVKEPEKDKIIAFSARASNTVQSVLEVCLCGSDELGR